MTDKPDETPEEEGNAAAEPADRRLRAAREERGLSVDEVAHDLHLDRNIILALESADYEGLGAPVFVRGYLRSYARLLELPEEDIVAAFDAPEIEPDEFRTRSMHTEVKPGANLVNFITHMREQFKTPGMPFIIARVLSFYGGETGQAAIVRDAQVKVAEADPNAAWFDTDDSPIIDPQTNQGHYNAEGNLLNGRRFAEAVKPFLR